MDSVEYYKERCHDLVVENERLKKLIQSMKDLLMNDNVSPSSTVDCVVSTAATSSSPILRGHCLVRDDFNAMSENIIGTDDFVPAFGSSPLLIAGSRDMGDPDETFYEPAEQEESVPQKEAHTAPKSSPQSPILCSGRAQGVRRRILCATDKRTSAISESSYDKLPESENEPNYPYAHKPVRGQKRKMLPGHTCKNCDEYYKTANIPKSGMDKCSRHRSKHSPVRSPKGFWDLEMPSTQWIRDRAANFPSPEKNE